MSRGLRYLILGIICLSMNKPLLAGGLDQLLFSPAGLRLDTTTFSVEDDHIFIEPKLNADCTPATGSICIAWNLVSDDLQADTTLLPFVQDGIDAWANESNISLQFQYQAIVSDNSIPYDFEADGVTKKLDSFGNPIIAGDFMISFNPPPEIIFPEGTISVSKLYVVPDLNSNKGEILWAGIFLNPAYTANTDYNLEYTVANEVGRIMGLSPSAVRSSVLFPTANITNQNVSLTQDDMLWGASQYPSNGFTDLTGSLSGKVINGEDGSSWEGAHLVLIPQDKLADFAKTLDRDLVVSGTFSGENGEFKFETLSEGQYLLMIEPLSSTSQERSSFNERMQFFAKTETFETEFYDGIGESNREPIFSFTPSSIYFAATLIVDSGIETSGVEVITNSADPNAKLIEASGSTNEILSDYLQMRKKEIDLGLIRLEDSPRSSGGGCSLEFRKGSGGIIFLLGLGFALCLLLLSRQGLKEE